MKKFEISKEYLDQVSLESAKSLVGKVMKRFEILEDKDDIKKSLKELIYENHRELNSKLKAFSAGVKFTSPKR